MSSWAVILRNGSNKRSKRETMQNKYNVMVNKANTHHRGPSIVEWSIDGRGREWSNWVGVNSRRNKKHRSGTNEWVSEWVKSERADKGNESQKNNRLLQVNNATVC